MRISFCCADTQSEPWLKELRSALPQAQISLWQPGADLARRRRLRHRLATAPGFF